MEMTKNKLWAVLIAGLAGWYGRKVGIDFGIDTETADLIYTVAVVPFVAWVAKNRPKPPATEDSSLSARIRRWIV